jgi:NADH-quinone oxidoreductase subunit E
MSQTPTPVSPEFEKKIDEIITHYPVSKRSASLTLLHHWQETYGFVSDEGIDWIARKLDLQPINILELVTFYPMFRRQPFGKNHVRVCRTLSCHLGGSDRTHACFKKATGANGDDHGPVHSPDGKYTIEYVECLASCGTAPVVMVNEDFYEGVDEAKVHALLQKYN